MRASGRVATLAPRYGARLVRVAYATAPPVRPVRAVLRWPYVGQMCRPDQEATVARTGTYYTLLVSAALAATGFTVLKIFPGSTVTANLAANDTLPHEWRVAVGVADTDSMTYSISASMLR